MAPAYGAIEQRSWVLRSRPALGMTRAILWILSNMILISSLASNSSVSLCSVCGPQYPKGDLMFLWTIITHAIATLGSRFTCAAGLQHIPSIAITKDGSYALFGLPYVIFLSLLPSGSPYRGHFGVGLLLWLLPIWWHALPARCDAE